VNLWDCQVAYCTRRDRESSSSDPYLKGLSMAIQACPGISYAEGQRLEALKNVGLRLFAPEQGGSYQVWSDRPLNPELITYAAADVHYLHAMRDAWVGLYKLLNPVDP
jgi:exonuclease 3'-5' domain-containing protein 1